MSSLAIIPARGGSQRIPRKNIKDFLGNPIIAYSIKAALESELFEEVMVSTDDAEIAKISSAQGAKVPFFRSEANANDFATTADVLLEVINQYDTLGKSFSSACCIYPTAPFITSQKLIDSNKIFEDKGFSTLFPVTRFSSPIQRALWINPNNQVKMFYPENLNKRSQDLEPAYHDAGQFYWFRPRLLKVDKKLWTANSGSVIYPEWEVQDIDQMHDWKIAELKFQINQQKL